MSQADVLIEKINKREAVIAVCGLGYVGLPLVMAFNKQGFKVIGFDIDQKKIDKLHKGESYIKHIDFRVIKQNVDAGKFVATADFGRIGEPDVILIAVPTPLTETREPDLIPVINTTESIKKGLRKNQLIVLESTTYPGTTEEVVKPILEKTGLKAGTDFFLAFSPEREDPGNPKFETTTIPKVVGGHDPDSKRISMAVYGSIIQHVVPVSSMGAAELTKILENTFRAVNIALVNELKLLCMRMDIDVWEVIEAASTKPFGFMPFYPGPGLGGHCIPIDPFYLTWKAREYDFQTKFIELAGEVNTSMPYHVIESTMYALNDRKMSLNGAKIMVLGVAYKADVDDLRESPALKIIDLLQDRGAEVIYNDPHCPVIMKTRKYDLGMESVNLTPEILRAQDAVMILTNHKVYDYEMIAKHANLILDTRNAMKAVQKRDNILKI
ncbi:MAG: nucleotide sugar dehydrogenase [Myxococcota bacterium]